MPADNYTMNDYLRHLDAGGRLRVTLANGTTGAVYIEPNEDINEPMYMFYSDWAGCYEAICEVGEAYLVNDSLFGADIECTESIWPTEAP